MRARKKSWADEELSINPIIVHEPEKNKGQWHKTFDNDNEIHLEIGCGKGGFVNKLSEQNPNINYIGLEREKHVIVMASRLIGHDRKNVRMVLVDADCLEDIFTNERISRIYLNFSDPWHKNRHKKRRLTHSNFLKIYENILDKNAAIFMKTDNQKLFEFSLNEFSDYNMKLKNITFNLHESDYEGNIMTEYEEKFSEQGMPIYRTEAYFRN